MKKGMKIGLAVLAVLLVMAGTAGLLFFLNTAHNDCFLRGTVINGIDVSGRTPAQAAEIFKKEFEVGQTAVEEGGKVVFRASLIDIGYRFDNEGAEQLFKKILEAENADLGKLMDGKEEHEYRAKIPCLLEGETFEQAVSVDALEVPRKENRDAKILYYAEEEKCRILPEVQGTLLEEKDLEDWLRAGVGKSLLEKGYSVRNIEPEKGEKDAESAADSEKAGRAAEKDTEEKKSESGKEAEEKKSESGKEAEEKKSKSGKEAEEKKSKSGKEAEEKKSGSGKKAEEKRSGSGRTNAAGEESVIRLEIPQSLYIPPKKKASDRKMKEKCSILNRYAGESVTYVFGQERETLDFSTILNWLKIRDGEVQIRDGRVEEYVSGLREKYETRYRDRVFTTTWGTQVTFPAGLNEYGYTILQAAEEEQLRQDILSGQKVEREPVYMTYNDWGCPLYYARNGLDDLVGTYVEVNLSAQHLWFYVNGSLIVETDVVTGDVTKNLGTASGVFPLAFKRSPDILRGGTGKDKYETKVQYWMPFYEGQGLHDANWKTVFGGTEYMGNGSHGCVNLPPWAAEVIYNNITPGTAIILYW